MAVQAATRRPRRSRPTPQRDLTLAHLSLAELRSYRQELQAEETQISYWRRIVQARLDVVRADPHGDVVHHLRQVLADAPGQSRRQALIDAVPVEDIPPLPELGRMWAREVDPTNADEVARMLAQLADAEQTLSSYRHALHERLDAATSELVARYHEDPLLALCALPVPIPDADLPVAAAGAAGRARPA